jgi:hypothetical protein
MSVTIRDSDLESKLKEHKRRRKHGTLARTARDLLKERIIQLEIESQDRRRTPQPTAAAG